MIDCCERTKTSIILKPNKATYRIYGLCVQLWRRFWVCSSCISRVAGWSTLKAYPGVASTTCSVLAWKSNGRCRPFTWICRCTSASSVVHSVDEIVQCFLTIASDASGFDSNVFQSPARKQNVGPNKTASIWRRVATLVLWWRHRRQPRNWHQIFIGWRIRHTSTELTNNIAARHNFANLTQFFSFCKPNLILDRLKL